ncbi:MAG: hypothetical protein ACYC26_00320 [Phycisphaerales bacterium]
MSFAFFRKYNKILLAVGGSILMVIFLIPQAASHMGQNSDPVVGNLAGKDIRANRVRTANIEIATVRALVEARYASLVQQFRALDPQKDPMQAYLLQQRIQQLGNVAQNIPTGNDSGPVWLMMLHEAEQQGLYASRSESRQILQTWDITAVEVAAAKHNLGVDDAFIYQALGHWQMTMRLRQLTYGQAVIPSPRGGTTFTTRLSEPALLHFARDIQSQIAVNYVAIPASRLLGQIAEPTEAELEERFNLSKNVPPGSSGGGSGQYGFGYRLPPRVKLEYIAVPLERAKQVVHVDEIEANRYYLQHPDEFLPKPDDKSKPGQSESSSAAPGSATVSKTPRPYRDVREDIIEKLTHQKALAKQDEAVKSIEAALNAAIRSWPLDNQTGYRVVPPGAAGTDTINLADVAQQVQQDTGIPCDVARDEKDWQPLTSLSDKPGIGQSILITGSGSDRRAYATAGYLSSISELRPPADHPLLPFHLQVGVPSKPVQDIAGTIYILRVLDAQPEHAPAALNEVRDQVVRDVKLLKAYGSLQEQSWSFLSAARSAGLDKFAQSLGKDVKVESLKPFSRRDLNTQPPYNLHVPNLTGIGPNEQFVDQCFKLAQPMQESGKLDALAPADRIAAVPVDQKLALCIVQITEYRPLTQQAFDNQRDILAMRLAINQHFEIQQQSAFDPFDYQTLAARVGYSTPQQEKTDKNEK